MNFKEIGAEDAVYPGEYLLYSPAKQIVICGAYNREEGYIRVLHEGRYVEDKIENFKKIWMSETEKRKRLRPGCKKCGKR